MDDDANIRFVGILIVGVMLVAGFFLSSGLVVGQTTTDPATDAQPQDVAFIRSRFMLWDTNEKSMDKIFSVVLISWSNSTSNYSIRINADYYNGTFYKYQVLNYSYKNESLISVFSVVINNNTALYATQIKLMAGITQSGINDALEPYKISFLPFELTKFEWNLIYSGIVAVFISLPSAYIIVKYYRKHRGAQIL